LDLPLEELHVLSSKTPPIALALVGSGMIGCGQNTTQQPEPAPVVFEDRLVIQETDDRSPLRIAPAELPRSGECRLWHQGRPVREQPSPGPCAQIEPTAPPESWILYRPSQDPRLVHVRIVDPERAGVVAQVRVYDAQRGTYLGSKQRARPNQLQQ
jgi:hypothetical protein